MRRLIISIMISRSDKSVISFPSNVLDGAPGSVVTLLELFLGKDARSSSWKMVMSHHFSFSASWLLPALTQSRASSDRFSATRDHHDQDVFSGFFHHSSSELFSNLTRVGFIIPVLLGRCHHPRCRFGETESPAENNWFLTTV